MNDENTSEAAESKYKKFKFRGLTYEKVLALPKEEFLKLITSRERRKLKRGLTHAEKKFHERLVKSDNKRFIKAKCRDMVVFPDMVGLKVGIYNGKEFVQVEIQPEMMGHRLGEFSLTRRAPKHSGPGIGATRSSRFVPLK
ncbi:MAG: 30S ribosomal protein S19 [Candidatus Aenigmarchaeota archaeon]|nr:30S ribosomal protein S19 [Candidatus Aenigmarchaeota archaeon]